ncbi:hypothetical protein BD324DRAFT_678553 [Kockovaella imperatae]|uniref:VanZ-like domain-containing protein n=1 Tax=Kockovaella imperatae TaxID=4999 RepID=A0A1Y1UT35_9TREE|nr:hypothetical protein BD324DRAFT_678553 [Kockovaella imperatae]ORX41171.1 hypothetical protein BD324DRAFT_678553 [Kockovaella imperatae]
MPLNNYPHPTAVVQHVYEQVTEYLMRSYPIRDLPLNLRPAMVMVTAAWLVLLGILGMAPLPNLPVNDKALHFFGMGFATFLLYFVIDVPDGPHRRVWYIRRAPLLLTVIFAFFVGGIISEFIQGLLPWKTFQWGDILANLLGSSLFLYLAHLLHARSRKRMEISTLYQPLSSHVYRDAQGRQHTFDASPTSHSPAQPSSVRPPSPQQGPYRHQRQGSNVWDEGSEAGRSSVEDLSRDTTRGTKVFDIGDEEELLDSPLPGNDDGR